MKRFITSILIFAMLLTCTSCQSTDAAKINSDLSIYVLDYDPPTKRSVDKFNSEREKGTVILKSYLPEEMQDYEETLLSELAHGMGPDIIILYSNYIGNISQYLNFDAFYDINELIKKDKSFKLDDYNRNILDCGVKDGKRYLIPLAYNVDALFSTEKALTSHNLNIHSKALTLDNMLSLAESFKGQAGDESFINELPFTSYIHYFVDPMNQTASFDSDEFRTFMDQHIKLRHSAAVVAENSWDMTLLAQGKVALFNMPIFSSKAIAMPYQHFDKAVTDPIFFGYTLSEQQNKIPATPYALVGINKNCVNKEGAYEFIKLLLSTDEQQYRSEMQGLPVNLEAYDNTKANSLQQSGGILDDTTLTHLKAQMDQIVKGELICRLQDFSINNIVSEEIMNYKEGIKTKEAASKDIQNRVITYFKERPSVKAPSTSDNASQAEKITLHAVEQEFIKVAVRNFNKSHKDVQIEETLYSVMDLENAITQLTTSVMAGEGPDILIYRNYFFNSMSKTMATGAFADLNPLIANDPSFDTTDYYPELFNAGVINGKRYYIPLFYYLPSLMASKSSLDALGISIDKSGWTFSDLKDAISKFKASNPSSGQYFFDSSMDFLSLVRSSGLRLVDYQTKSTSFKSKEFIELMELYKEIVPLIIPVEAESKLGLPEYLLKDNIIRMVSLRNLSPLDLAAEYSILDAAQLKDDVVLLPFPTAKAGAGTPAVLNGIVSIGAQCKNQQAAFDFIKLLLSEEIQTDYSDHRIPSQGINKKAYIKDMESAKQENESIFSISSRTFKSVPLGDAMADMAMGLINHMAAPANLDQEIENIINEGLQAYLSGKLTAEDAAKEIDAKVTLYLNE